MTPGEDENTLYQQLDDILTDNIERRTVKYVIAWPGILR